MATINLGACEWFVGDLRRSNLFERAELDQVVEEFLKRNPRVEPAGLAEYLVNEGLLTTFQAKRLLVGNIDLLMGPFAMVAELGSGSMGAVYKAISKKDTKPYALKILPRRSMWDATKARRVVRQFEQCQHVAVVPFADVGTQGNFHYLAWPLVEGMTVEKVVQQRGPIDPPLAALYALQIAEALEVCHQVGLIHGMVKPANLMVGRDQQVRILDFGIRLLLTDTELLDTQSSTKLTSDLDCSSPEITLDPTKQSPASDRYSLGCTLYFMLCGHYPFEEGGTREKILSHQMKVPEPVASRNSAVPAKLSAVVDKLLQKVPESRYASTAEAVTALKPLATKSPPRWVDDPNAEPVPEVEEPAAVETVVAPTAVTPPTVQPRPQPMPMPPLRPIPARDDGWFLLALVILTMLVAFVARAFLWPG